MQSRKQIVGVIEAIDEQIERLQQSKRDTYDAHRSELTAIDGKEVAKAEIEGLKKAVQRRRQIAKSGITAIEQREALVEEILAEVAGDENAITGRRAARHPRVAQSMPNHETPDDDALIVDPVSGDGPVPAPVIAEPADEVAAPAVASSAPNHEQPQDADVHGVEAAEEQSALATDDAHEDRGLLGAVEDDGNSEPANTGGEDVNAAAHTGEADAEPIASPANSHIVLAIDEPPPFHGSFKNSHGAWRMEGCQKPDACAGMWNRRCGSCQKAFVASHPVTDGAPA